MTIVTPRRLPAALKYTSGARHVTRRPRRWVIANEMSDAAEAYDFEIEAMPQGADALGVVEQR